MLFFDFLLLLLLLHATKPLLLLLEHEATFFNLIVRESRTPLLLAAEWGFGCLLGGGGLRRGPLPPKVEPNPNLTRKSNLFWGNEGESEVDWNPHFLSEMTTSHGNIFFKHVHSFFYIFWKHLQSLIMDKILLTFLHIFVNFRQLKIMCTASPSLK